MVDAAPDLWRLKTCGAILCVKVYRVEIAGAGLTVPVIPCLDHEAMLHHQVDPHVSAYLLEPTRSELHEVAIYPSRRRLEIDTVSTLGEFSEVSQQQLIRRLRETFPDCKLSVKQPSVWRADRRVADACRAQITLRDVLMVEPTDLTKRQIDRLHVVGSLMEKQSRVASWGVRTVNAPLLTATGVVLYAVLGAASRRLGDVQVWQYAIIGTLGGVFLYYGVKAVQLTDTANRVWKRASEYSLILAERKRLSL